MDAQHSVKVCCYCDVLELNWINYLTVIFNSLWLFFLMDRQMKCTFPKRIFLFNKTKFSNIIANNWIYQHTIFLPDKWWVRPYSGDCMCTVGKLLLWIILTILKILICGGCRCSISKTRNFSFFVDNHTFVKTILTIMVNAGKQWHLVAFF